TVKDDAQSSDIDVENLFICLGESVNLTATSSTITNPIFRFYLDEDLTEEVSSTSISPQVTTRYYVTVEGDEVCESKPEEAAHLTVTVRVTEKPEIENPNQAFCNTDNATLESIAIVGEGILWYSSLDSDTPLPANTLLVDGETYYASQTNPATNCESVERAMVTIQILTCDMNDGLVITKTANNVQVLPGEEVVYTITVLNSSEVPMSDVTVKDELSDYLEYTSSTNGGVNDGGTVTWNLASIDSKEIVELLLTVRVSQDTPVGTEISNVAIISSPDDPDTPKETDPEIITVVNPVSLSVTKSANVETVLPGGLVVYMINVMNSGQGIAGDVTIHDTLDEALEFIAATDGGTVSNGVVTWEISELGAGESRTVTLEVQVAEDVTGGTEISNVAIASSPDEPEGPKESDPEIVVVEDPVSLTISKSADKKEVLPGDQVIYTITVTNPGSQLAENLIISDTLNSNLQFINASESGVLTEGVVVWELNELAAGESKVFTLTVGVNASTQVGTSISNIAVVTDPDDPDSPDESDPEIIEVIDPVSFTITKVPDVEKAMVGDQITYTIIVSNISEEVKESILVTDTLTEELTFISADQGATFSNSVVEWIIPSLAPGQVIELTLLAQVNEMAEVGDILFNTAIVDDPKDPETPKESDPGDGVEVIDDQTGIQVWKYADLESVEVGEMIDYIIRIENVGEYTAWDISVVDSLPAGTMVMNMEPEGELSEEAVSWMIESMDAGEVMEINLRLMVTEKVDENLVNWVFISGRNFPDTETSSDPVPVDELPNEVDLEITKEVSSPLIMMESNFEYKISITNNSEARANKIVMTDTLSSAVEYLGHDVSAGTASYNSENRTLTWMIDELEAGATQMLTFRVKAIAEGDVSNTAWVSSDDVELDPDDNSSTVDHRQMFFEIPNVFTPNGDGRNDTWVLRGLQEFFSRNEILIVNRWGVEVYQSDDYQNDWNGDNLVGGTYYYQVNLWDHEGVMRTMTGFVTIIK
ncbi:gliding motility-associated C-terminal domain-containing protein, partial [Algoriphagus sp. PAP.12]|uniref:T9SS type B sorting domain-containing protein n=1 Tax=Algoriphagus sp. PAP.12 TaxID=2996678 RepID=UPI00227A0BC1